MSVADHPKLFKKIVAAQKAIDSVPKDATNSFHNYAYTSIEGLVKATRAELIKRNVLVIPGLDHLEERDRQTNQGTSTVTDAHVIMTVLDADTGERFEAPWIGRGDDPADKGLSKALTDARKTFLLHLLNIARGDDTEGDENTDVRTYSGPVQNGAAGVNLVEEARGLSNEQLNRALVTAGLPAQQKPFGFFYRVPAAQVEAVREGLASVR